MRDTPQVGHPREFAPGGDHEADRADQAPGHATASQAPRGGDAQVGRGGLEAVEELSAGQRVALEVPARERCAVALLRHPHERAGEVGQVGPSMRQIERAGVDQLAGAQRLHDRLVEPAAGAAAEEVARAHDARGEAARGGPLGDRALHAHTQFALAGARALRRVLAQQRGHRLAVVVHVAGQHEVRAEPLGDGEAGFERGHRLGIPACVGRVDRMHDHRGAAGRSDEGLGVVERDRHGLGDTVELGVRRAAHLGQHTPSRCREGAGRGGAEAAVGAEDQHGRARSGVG